MTGIVGAMTRCRSTDPLNPARGIVNALAFSVAAYVLGALMLWWAL